MLSICAYITRRGVIIICRWIVVFCGIQATAWTTAATSRTKEKKNEEEKWFISVLMFRLIELKLTRPMYSQIFLLCPVLWMCIVLWAGSRLILLWLEKICFNCILSLFKRILFFELCVLAVWKNLCTTYISSLYSCDFVRHQPRLISNTPSL